jgi:hypothetical protein
MIRVDNAGKKKEKEKEIEIESEIELKKGTKVKAKTAAGKTVEEKKVTKSPRTTSGKLIAADPVKVLKKKPVAASSKPKTTKTAKLKKEKAIEKPFQSLNISDIVALSDTRVKKIIKDLEIETVSAAMKGADKKVREKVEKNLGVRALKTYKELLKGIKTLSESEIRKSRKLFENQFKKHTK